MMQPLNLKSGILLARKGTTPWRLCITVVPKLLSSFMILQTRLVFFHYMFELL